jgi:hypothetical protein
MNYVSVSRSNSGYLIEKYSGVKNQARHTTLSLILRCYQYRGILTDYYNHWYPLQALRHLKILRRRTLQTAVSAQNRTIENQPIRQFAEILYGFPDIKAICHKFVSSTYTAQL